MTDAVELIGLVKDGKHSRFIDSVHDELTARAATALQNAQQALAQSLFVEPEEVDELEDEDTGQEETDENS